MIFHVVTRRKEADYSQMIQSIFIILVLTIIQIVIRFIWHSKFLFGRFFTEISFSANGDIQNIDSYKSYIVYAFLKSMILVYIIDRLSILLPESLFAIVLSILGLVFVNNMNSSPWSKSGLIALLLDSLEGVFSSIVVVTVAFFILNI